MHDASGSWRLSIAEIGERAPFSSLPGRDRFLVVADGDVLLRVDGDERRLVAGEAREFRGESEASAVAVGHPAQVVNLMVVRGSAEFSASGPHPVREIEVPRREDDIVLLLWRGLTLDGQSVEPGTLVRATPDAGPHDDGPPSLVRFPEPVLAYRLSVRPLPEVPAG
jgi:environmental stress-induced protein Ves